MCTGSCLRAPPPPARSVRREPWTAAPGRPEVTGRPAKCGRGPGGQHLTCWAGSTLLRPCVEPPSPQQSSPDGTAGRGQHTGRLCAGDSVRISRAGAPSGGDGGVGRSPLQPRRVSGAHLDLAHRSPLRAQPPDFAGEIRPRRQSSRFVQSPRTRPRENDKKPMGGQRLAWGECEVGCQHLLSTCCVLYKYVLP